MQPWSFLTNHGRVLLCIARDPEVRLRDIAAAIGITERRAQGIVSDLVEAGYAVRTREGRRNRYQIQVDMPLPDPLGQEHAIGELIDLLAGVGGRRRSRRRSGRERRATHGEWTGPERRTEKDRRTADGS